MAFFEDLGRIISDAGQSVAQSGRNVMDIAKLNNSISDKKRQITQNFSAIGEKYYEMHKDEENDIFSEQIGNVTRLNLEIHDCEEQIKTIRGITKCPNCGSDIAAGSAFCSVCGAPVQAKAQPETSAQSASTRETDSPAQSASTRETDSPVQAASSGGADSPVQSAAFKGSEPTAQAVASSQPKNAVKTCPNCHEPVSPGERFCTSCGAKLAEE